MGIDRDKLAEELYNEFVERPEPEDRGKTVVDRRAFRFFELVGEGKLLRSMSANSLKSLLKSLESRKNKDVEWIAYVKHILSGKGSR